MANEYENIRTALVNRVDANLATIDLGYTAADVSWEGASFNMEGKAHWMRVEVHFTNRGLIGPGSPQRIDGFLQLGFFTHPADGGDVMDALMKRLDAATGLFPITLRLAAGASFIRFFTSSAEPHFDDDEGWIHQPLRIPFTLDTA